MPIPSENAVHAALPASDTRAAVPPHTLNTPRTFLAFLTRAAWEARRAFLRQQLLVSFGLYPLPPKTPLRAKIFGKIARDGYTIEKVYFQTYPGFYLAGNLYRPKIGVGRQALGVRENTQIPNAQRPTPDTLHPGVLVTHGHWRRGRMANGPDGSISARAITFARQGYVAFTYDMVGFNDTRQIDHKFANDRKHWLWGVSLMGLQTWNSIRALDFLCSLPDVDKSRLAITGESGGGTQTMMLGALEDRLAAVGPCVMLSHFMQGGCLCENAPGLRVDFSNMEIAAAAAPRPQILVAATGDWTRDTLTVEGPALESVYKLYGEPEHLKYVLFDYGHNINKTSREAVYAFFGKWLLGETDKSHLNEPPYTMEPVENLRVFPADKPLPKDAKTADALTQSLMLLGQSEVERRKPHDRRSLTQFQKTFRPAWEHTLAVEIPPPESLLAAAQAPASGEGFTVTRLNLGREERGDNIPALLFTPQTGKAAEAVVIAHPEGRAALLEPNAPRPTPHAQRLTPNAFVRSLLTQGRSALLLDAFLTGERADAKISAARDRPFGEFFSTYNRTDLQERVQDLITACAYAKTKLGARRVTLVGLGKAGLWALLAAPAADAVAADCAQLDLTTDDALLADDLFVPCLRRLGDFHTAAVLAAPHPLLLHNTGRKFASTQWITEVYQAIGAGPSLRVETKPLDNDALALWITSQK